jgi:hypothetical protein
VILSDMADVPVVSLDVPARLKEVGVRTLLNILMLIYLPAGQGPWIHTPVISNFSVEATDPLTVAYYTDGAHGHTDMAIRINISLKMCWRQCKGTETDRCQASCKGSVCGRCGGKCRTKCRANQSGSTCTNQDGKRTCMEPGDLPGSEATGEKPRHGMGESVYSPSHF